MENFDMDTVNTFLSSLGAMLSMVAIFIAKRIAGSTETKIDDKLVEILEKTTKKSTKPVDKSKKVLDK